MLCYCHLDEAGIDSLVPWGANAGAGSMPHATWHGMLHAAGSSPTQSCPCTPIELPQPMYTHCQISAKASEGHLGRTSAQAGRQLLLGSAHTGPELTGSTSFCISASVRTPEIRTKPAIQAGQRACVCRPAYPCDANPQKPDSERTVPEECLPHVISDLQAGALRSCGAAHHGHPPACSPAETAAPGLLPHHRSLHFPSFSIAGFRGN